LLLKLKKQFMKLIKIISALCLLPGFIELGMAQNVAKHKKPAYQTIQEKSFRNPAKNEALFKSNLYKRVPTGIIHPGEFEESQAVAISWSFDYDVNGNPSGLDLSSEYADVSAKLAHAIQKECSVWIRVLQTSDTTLVINNMISRGTPLTNYKFIIAPGDDWWTRDYGPMAFYSSNLDSIGFVDMKYYDGRDKDNVFPSQLAAAMGYNNYVTQLNSEGGNLMADGFGKMFFSSVVVAANADPSIHSTPWTKAQTYDTMRQIFNTPELIDLTTLNCDGGTGHIDLYVKLIDEQTIIMAQYPSEITAPDRQIIEDNYQLISGLKSTYNRPFRILRVEHPTNDAGVHSRKTCNQIDADARNFINGLTVNGSYIFPSYYDGNTGNAAQHQRIMAFYQRYMPGYNIVPIDSRDLSPLGGAIHCITMQIPVENPIRFWHPSIDGIVPALDKYHIISKISNKNGISEASCYWKKNNASSWNKVLLTDSSGYWVGDILNANLQGDDSLFYYLEAKSVNGKTATKPLNASKGAYYSMKLRYLTSIDDIEVPNLNHLFTAFPNPTNETVTIQYKLNAPSAVNIQVIDIFGKLVYESGEMTEKEGMYGVQIKTSELAEGIYLYRMVLNNEVLQSKKLLIKK